MLQRLLAVQQYGCRGHFHHGWLVGLCITLALSIRFWLEAGRAGQEKDKPRKRIVKERAVEKFMKSFIEPIRIRESKPVTVKNAKFVLAAQTNWKPPKPNKDFPMVAPVQIQLHITNLSKTDVSFPTWRTFGVQVLSADGMEVKLRRKNKGPNLTPPLWLSAGASYGLCRRAELRWDEKTKASELLYYDGTGAQSIIGPLKPGRYKLVFWYSVLPGKEKTQKKGDPPTWAGKAVTNEVSIKVLDETMRGIVTGKQDLRVFTEPIRIRESKPVKVNGVQFVLVAQADWKPAKRGKIVPIEIQLRITNLGKTALMFPTFDTFGLRILNWTGAKIMPRGGRDITIMTRPVLLPGGASYSVCRRADLHWDAITKASELRYYDGTGWEFYFGPLKHGRYKLAFWYGVGSNGPFKTERDPATWLGGVVIGDVVIEVLAR
jgi:hypothetical protein